MTGNRLPPSATTIPGATEFQEQGLALAGEPFRDFSLVPQ
jgi:hypothetical protein